MRKALLLAVLAALLVLPASAGAAVGTDLAVAVAPSSDSVDAGAQITYTITVSNAASSAHTASNVQLSSAIPTNTTLVSWSQTGGPTFSVSGTGPVTATRATLAPGESATFALVVRVNPGYSGASPITQSATVNVPGDDPNPGNNAANTSTDVTTHADLSVALIPTATTVNPGDNIVYKVALVNDGPSTARTVSVTAAAPPGTTLTGANAPPGGSVTANGSSVTFSYGDVAPGSAGLAQMTVTTDPATPDPTLLDATADASSPTADPDTSNNSATARVGVGTKADLAVAMTESTDPVERGALLTYTVSLTNDGVDASDVVVTDTVPAGTTFVSARQTGGGQSFALAQPAVGAGGDVSFTLGRLTAGGGATFEIVVKVDDSAVAGSTVKNTVTATTSTTQTSSANDSASTVTTVASHPAPPPVAGTVVDLRTTATVKPKRVRRGRNVRVTFKVSNRGNKEATRARLTGRLPHGLRLVATVSNAGQCVRHKKIDCDLGTVVPGKSRTVTVVLRVTRKGRFAVRARASSAQKDARPSNNTAAVSLRGR